MHEVFFEKLSCSCRGTWIVNRFVPKAFDKGQCDGRMRWDSCEVNTDQNRVVTTVPLPSNYVPIKPPLLYTRGKKGAEEIIEHLTRWESDSSILQRRAAVTTPNTIAWHNKNKQIEQKPRWESASSILQCRLAVTTSAVTGKGGTKGKRALQTRKQKTTQDGRVSWAWTTSTIPASKPKKKKTVHIEEHTGWEGDLSMSCNRHSRIGIILSKKKIVQIEDHIRWEGDLSIDLQSQRRNHKKKENIRQNQRVIWQLTRWEGDLSILQRRAAVITPGVKRGQEIKQYT